MFKLFKSILAANETQVASEPDGLGTLVANQYDAANSKSADNWVQLSPFGKFPNVVGIQVFEPGDAQNIVNEFNSTLSAGVRQIGLPWYIGHPDHPDFKDVYTDSSAKGRIKTLQVRKDDSCQHCLNFVNQTQGSSPCREHGLFGNVKWNDDGRQLIANESYHGHSVNWRMRKSTDGFHPFSLKSVGFTNEPGIPVQAITVANQMSKQENGKPADNQSGVAKKPGLMQYVGKLLGKPDLEKEGANEDDAIAAMDSYAANAKKTAEDYQKLQSEHNTLKGVVGMLHSTYGANEVVEPVLKSLTDDLKLTVPAEGVLVFVANELKTRTTKLSTVEASLLAANERATTAETLVANQRKDFADKTLGLLVVGGFLTGAESDAMKKGVDFANEAQFTKFIGEAVALKPKINVVSQVGPLGKMSSDVQAANHTQVARTDAIVTAVNEYQDAEQTKTGKRPDYMKAFGHVQRTRKDLFAEPEKTITR